MEMDMARKSKNKHGITFEGKMDLSRWDFNRIEFLESDARSDMKEKIEKCIEKALDEYWKKIEPTDARIRKIASEALQISFEKEAEADFCNLNTKPELITLWLSDFAEDGYSVTINLKEIVKHAVLSRCYSDGYVMEEFASAMNKFSEMFSELAEYTKTSVRPK